MPVSTLHVCLVMLIVVSPTLSFMGIFHSPGNLLVNRATKAVCEGGLRVFLTPGAKRDVRARTCLRMAVESDKRAEALRLAEGARLALLDAEEAERKVISHSRRGESRESRGLARKQGLTTAFTHAWLRSRVTSRE